MRRLPARVFALGCMLLAASLWPQRAAASLPEEKAPLARRPASTRGPVPAALQRGTATSHRTTSVRGAEPGEATTTLSGRLFYEDHRRNGRHVNRSDMRGKPGRTYRLREHRKQDFLGAFFMVVDVYELDRKRKLAPGCSRTEWVGAATVDRDGSFSVEVPAADRCTTDDGSPPEYALRVRTRFCHEDLCFKVGPSRGRAYTLWYGLETPLRPQADGSLRAPLLFSPEGRAEKNDWSRAANHYASLVDAVYSLHVVGGIPFRREEFGPLTVRFPSSFSQGRATSATLIDANTRGWPKGNLILHEYGHIVHRRAWNGDYAGHHDPIQSWSGKRRTTEEPFIAFKEGWANFVSNYVTGRCFRPGYDRGEELTSLKRGVAGNHFPQNHHHALCDWVDSRDDLRRGGRVGDTVSIDIRELWTLLDQTDDHQDRYPSHDPVREGLDICDLAAAHLLAVPARTPQAQAERVRQTFGLLENNDIRCPTVRELYRALPAAAAASPSP